MPQYLDDNGNPVQSNYLDENGNVLASQQPPQVAGEPVKQPGVMDKAQAALASPAVNNVLGYSAGVMKGLTQEAYNALKVGSLYFGDPASALAGMIQQHAMNAAGVESGNPDATVSDVLAPKTRAQQVGSAVAKAAPYVLGGAAVEGAVKDLPALAQVGANALGQGVVGYGSAKLSSSEHPIAEGVINGAIGAVLPPAATSAIAEKLTPMLVNKVLSPALKLFDFGANPGRAVATEKLSATSVGGLMEQSAAKLKERGQEVRDIIQKSPSANTPSIDILGPATDILSDAQKIGNHVGASPERLNKMYDALWSDVRQFTGGKGNLITPVQAQQLKEEFGKAINFVGGDEASQTANTVAHRLYTALDKAIDNVVPAAQKANQRYADLMALTKALEKRASDANARGWTPLKSLAMNAAMMKGARVSANAQYVPTAARALMGAAGGVSLGNSDQ